MIDNDETYVWIVKIDTRSQAQQILLSNDNQVETGCSACLPWPPS